MSGAPRDAQQRWDKIINESEHAGRHLARVDNSVIYSTDASGAAIVEHADGRFRLNSWTGKYERCDG